MDSLTQIVLGAAVGEAVLGKKIGNKAIFYGAIAGTIPDLDVIAANFTDTVSGLAIHRGFSHSILFSLILSPILGSLVSKLEKHKSRKDWTLFFFLGLVTHPILDAFTTWGTQLFWPFEHRLAFKNIFVIDPLYTLPFLFFLVLTMAQKKETKKRRTYNNWGLILSSSYLVLTLFLKLISFQTFKQHLKKQKINYTSIQTKPTALNTILWTANVKTENSFFIGHHSFFDSKPIQFSEYPKNWHLLGDLQHHPKMQQMIAISNEWFTIQKKDNQLFYNDLRFGTLSLDLNAEDFVFQYKIEHDKSGSLSFREVSKEQKDVKKLLTALWTRVKGN